MVGESVRGAKDCLVGEYDVEGVGWAESMFLYVVDA